MEVVPGELEGHELARGVVKALRELGRYSFRGAVGQAGEAGPAGTRPSEVGDPWLDQEDTGQGSIMMVVATDAPLDPLHDDPEDLLDLLLEWCVLLELLLVLLPLFPDEK